MIASWETPKIGDRFDAGDSIVTVTRRSVTAGWVDIAVRTANGAQWTKRMPEGIPVAWLPIPREDEAAK